MLEKSVYQVKSISNGILKSFGAFGAFLLLATMPINNAEAQTRTQVGSLVCEVSPSIGLIVVSRKNLKCRFTSTDSGYREYYLGSVGRVGLDIGFTGRGVLSWLVFAPTSQFYRGALEGDYVGVSTEATLGLGLGANALVGGFDRSFALQPLSFQGQTGLNAAVGISVLKLRSAKVRW